MKGTRSSRISASPALAAAAAAAATMVLLSSSPSAINAFSVASSSTRPTTTSTTTTTASCNKFKCEQRRRSSIAPMPVPLRQTLNNEDNIISISDDDSSSSSSSSSPKNSSSSSSSSMSTLLFDEESASASSLLSSSSAQFGDVVSLKRPSSSSSNKDDSSSSPFAFSSSTTSTSPLAKTASLLQQQQSKQGGIIISMKKRNWAVAGLSIGLAVMNYVWQYLHPITPIQILYEMEQQSSPITVIGTTLKPTVVDFWAPWCENCKLLAPTLKAIEEEYGKDVNFVMINGDEASAWPMIEAFGVDAIPHLALVEADGTVDTALIGPVPKQWLERDLQVLKENAKTLAAAAADESSASSSSASASSSSSTTTRLQPLPYQMMDVFANRPNERRIQVVVQKEVPVLEP